MKSYKFCLVVLCAGVFAACGGGSKSGGGLSTLESGNPSGAYTVTQEVDENYKEHYTVGCKDRNGMPAPQVDSRLKDGMVFTETLMIKNSKASASMQGSSTLSNVSSKGFNTDINIISVSGIQGVAPGTKIKSTCLFNGSGMDCQYDPQMNAKLPEEDCKTGLTETPAEKYYLGKLTMPSGRTISTFEARATTKAQLQCPNYNGEGTVEFRYIRSNDVPSKNAHFCGGTTVFGFYTLKKPDGTVVQAVAFELSH